MPPGPLRRTPKSSRWALLLPLAMVVLAGCSEGSPNEQSEELADQWLRSASTSEAAVLRDSRVSDSEYAQAVEDTASCLNDLGLDTGAVHDSPDGIRKQFLVIQGDYTTAEGDAAWRQCWEEHLDGIESVYLAQHAQWDADPNALDQELLDCLSSTGLTDLPTGMTDAEVFQALRSADARTEAWVCRELWLIAQGALGATPPD